MFAGPGLEQFGGLAWRVQTGGPGQSSPTVANGVVYVGSGDGHLYALDARTGAERWRFNARHAVTASPALQGELVFMGRFRRWRRRGRAGERAGERTSGR